MEIMQGDQYHIAIELKINDQPITDISIISDIEVCIGKLIKTMSSGEIIYSDSEKVFLFPISQKEAFNIPGTKQNAQIRVKFKNGDIIGERLGRVDWISSLSRTVM